MDTENRLSESRFLLAGVASLELIVDDCTRRPYEGAGTKRDQADHNECSFVCETGKNQGDYGSGMEHQSEHESRFSGHDILHK